MDMLPIWHDYFSITQKSNLCFHQLWQMAANTEPGSGSAGSFLLLNGSFFLHSRYTLVQED